MKAREKQIKILQKNSNLSLNEIGQQLHPPVSGERVRQILNPTEYEKCEKHKVLFRKGGKCGYCIVEKTYPKILRNIAKQGTIKLALEFERLSRQDRTKGIVIQRTLLIKFLRDKQKVSLTDISRLLNRDYTSIKNLYSKEI